MANQFYEHDSKFIIPISNYNKIPIIKLVLTINSNSWNELTPCPSTTVDHVITIMCVGGLPNTPFSTLIQWANNQSHPKSAITWHKKKYLCILKLQPNLEVLKH